MAVDDADLEELWTWSLRVKAASFVVDQADGPAFGETGHVIVSLDSGTAAGLRSRVHSQSSPLSSLTTPPEGPAVPIAPGAEQRKPADCAEPRPWNQHPAKMQHDKRMNGWNQSFQSPPVPDRNQGGQRSRAGGEICKSRAAGQELHPAWAENKQNLT